MFANYLQRVIRVDEAFYEHKRIRKQLRNTNKVFSGMRIRDCTFIGIQTNHVSGGAVLCFGNLDISRCRFENCTSTKTGGAIAVFGELILKESQFLHIRAVGSGVIFAESLNCTQFNMSDTSMDHIVSDNHDGLVMKRNESVTSWHRNNISNGWGVGHYGCVIFERGSAHFSHSIWNCCQRGDFNNGLALMMHSKFRVERCLFRNLSRGSDVDFGSVAFFCDRCIDGMISSCSFVDCQTRDQGSIFVRYGVSLDVVNCCFTTPEKTERRRHRIVFKSCSFAASACPFPINTKAEVPTPRLPVLESMRLMLVIWCGVTSFIFVLSFASLCMKKKTRGGFSKLL